MSPLLPGLASGGQMVVLGAAADPLTVNTPDLIFGTRTLSGSLTGTPIENEDNLAFSVQQGIRSMNEVVPLTDAPKAYERMLAGDARLRMVLDMTA